MQSINSGPSFMMGLIVGVPSFAATVLQGETLTLMGGIAAGIVGLGWTIYRASNDQRFDAILDRLDKAEKEVDETLAKLTAVNTDNVALRLKVDEIQGNYELLKRRLSVHVCPPPADPNVKCGLADIIKITL